MVNYVSKLTSLVLAVFLSPRGIKTKDSKYETTKIGQDRNEGIYFRQKEHGIRLVGKNDSIAHYFL